MTDLLPCLAAVVLALGQTEPEEAAGFSFYVGQRLCLQCHVRAGPAAPCGLERIPQHERAYDALRRPEASEIALLSGVAEPPERSRICLGCHSTAADVGPRWTRPTFDPRDGVQCEACHDAGSRHAASCRSAVRSSPPSGPAEIRRGDRGACGDCHVPRPSHEAVLVRGFRRGAADRLYQTPVNLACSPDGRRLYVVCEHSDRLVVVDPAAGRVLQQIPVGRRPHDVAVSPDGRRLYVTNRFSDSMTVLDADGGHVLRTVPVGHEPHGVRTDAAGRLIYVANTGEDSISVIDAARRVELRRLVAGVAPWSFGVGRGSTALYVTSLRPNPAPFRAATRSEITVLSPAEGVAQRRIDVAEANILQGIAAVPGRDVALFTLIRTKNLVPLTRLAQGWGVTNGLGLLWDDGRVDQVLLDEPNDAFPDPMAVAVSPDGRFALVTSGGSDRVAVVDVPRLLALARSASPEERRDVLPNHLGTSARFVVRRVRVGHNPRGVAFAPDGSVAYVANALDDSVSVLDGAGFAVVREIALGGPDPISEIRRGERLFHSAAAVFSQQFSCRSCHPDGHTNGLTFDLEPDGIGLGPVENRSLRGILDTAPFKWNGLNPTLQRQCGPRFAVFFSRTAPLPAGDTDALARYIATIERPPNRFRSPDGLSVPQRRGKAVFERAVSNAGKPIPPEQRCITCHNTPYRTAHGRATVGTTMWFDKPVDVPLDDLFDADSFGHLGIVYFYDTGSRMERLDAAHLTNVYDSPPYLHNGAARTLEEIWTRFNLYEGHGRTNDLTRRQFNDLIAYLKSL